MKLLPTCRDDTAVLIPHSNDDSGEPNVWQCPVCLRLYGEGKAQLPLLLADVFAGDFVALYWMEKFNVAKVVSVTIYKDGVKAIMCRVSIAKEGDIPFLASRRMMLPLKNGAALWDKYPNGYRADTIEELRRA